MSDSRSHPAIDTSSDEKNGGFGGKDMKSPNVFEKARKELEKVIHRDKHGHRHHDETHGLSDDIDLNIPIGAVKAPNLFERAKEEIEAIVEAIHPNKDAESSSDSPSYGVKKDSAAKDYPQSKKSELHTENVSSKEEADSHKHQPHHCKETHGMSYDIDENTPISAVKGPSVFERAKEEVEALVQAIHHRKDSQLKS